VATASDLLLHPPVHTPYAWVVASSTSSLRPPTTI